jgi:hypothetical protein
VISPGVKWCDYMKILTFLQYEINGVEFFLARELGIGGRLDRRLKKTPAGSGVLKFDFI